MSIIIDEKFYDSIPKEAQTRAVARIDKLVEELKENHQLVRNLSKGFYCRQIKGAQNRYKFRVSNGDRIVCCYQNGHEDICLLRYCNHDAQIFTAKNVAPTPLKVVDASYQEDDFDKEVYQGVLEEYQEGLMAEVLEGAYNIANHNRGMGRKAKFLYGALEIEKIIKEYKSHEPGKSGITFHTGEQSYLTESVLLHTLQKIDTEYHLIPAPYMEASFPGHDFFSPAPHFLDEPFFAAEANLEETPKEYIKVFAHEVYQYFGLIPKDFDFALEVLFRDPSDSFVSKSFDYDIATNTLKEIPSTMNITEPHDGRINPYIHALSLTSPEKIGRFNYRYLFD